MTTVTTRNPVRIRPDHPRRGLCRPVARSSAWAFAGAGAAVLGASRWCRQHGRRDLRPAHRPGRGGIPPTCRRPSRSSWSTRHPVRAVLCWSSRPVSTAGSWSPPDPSRPMIAFAGLAGTAVVSMLGTGLDTEFMPRRPRTRPRAPRRDVQPLDRHDPVVWTLAGLAGLAIFSVARAGRSRAGSGAGLVLGGLTVLLRRLAAGVHGDPHRRPLAARHLARLPGRRQAVPRRSTETSTRHDAGPAPTGPGRLRRGTMRGDAARHRAAAPARRGLAVFAVSVALDLAAPAAGPGRRGSRRPRLELRPLGLVVSGSRLVVLRRDARQLFGWMLGWFGVFWSLDALAQSYIRYGVRTDERLPG